MPWYKNVLIKEQEKIAKYVPLAKDLTKVRKMSTKIVLVVIGGFGFSVTKHLKELDIPDIIDSLQIRAIESTYNILHKVLNRKE